MSIQREEIYVELIDNNGTLLQKALRYDANAIAAFEQASGKSFNHLLFELGEAGEQKILQVLSITVLRAAIWSGLLWRTTTKRPLKIEEIGAMMPMDFKKMMVNATKVMTAMMRAIGHGTEDLGEMEEAINENFTSAEESPEAP